MKNRKLLFAVLNVLLIASFVIAGCAPKAAPSSEQVVAEAPVVEPTAAPTEAPVVEPTVAPTEAPFSIEPMVMDYIANLPEGFATITAADLKAQMDATTVFIVDLREPGEITDNGFIPGAINIPIRSLAQNLDKLPAKDQPFVVYCGIGHRGAIALEALNLLGYTNVKSLVLGFKAWTAAELPVEKENMAAPVAGTMPEVDAEVLAVVDAYLSSLPEGFAGIAPAALNDQIAAAKPFILDVREPQELIDNGYIADAVNIPIRSLFADLSLLPADKTTPIVVYCAVGHRGGLALTALHLLGYTNAKSLTGGFNAWAAAELPVVK